MTVIALRGRIAMASFAEPPPNGEAYRSGANRNQDRSSDQLCPFPVRHKLSSGRPPCRTASSVGCAYNTTGNRACDLTAGCAGKIERARRKDWFAEKVGFVLGAN